MQLCHVKLFGNQDVTIDIDGQKISAINASGSTFSRPTNKSPLKSLKQFFYDTAHGQGHGQYDGEGLSLFPAGIDVHVHSRDPGYTHKEDWQNLARSAYKGGVVGVVDMPNTFPPTFHPKDVKEKARIAENSGLDYKILLGTGADNIDSLRETLCDPSLPLAGIKVYYGQSTGNLMFSDLEALEAALPRNYNGILVFHSEDQCRIDHRQESLLVSPEHDKSNRQFEVHSAIRDSESAWISTRKILDWARTCPFRVHLAHASTPKEITWLDESRMSGGRLSSEVSPHHVLLDTGDYERLGPFLKVNPPVRSSEEVRELREQLKAGLIDCFATDHAPHTIEEKQRAYHDCPSGIPSIEFYWPLLALVAKKCGLSLEQIAPMAGLNPAKLFGFDDLGRLSVGSQASFVLLESSEWTIKNENVAAKCGWSPYTGMKVPAKVMGTWHKGRCVYTGDMI